MRRAIHELLAAVAAGDPLTTAEAQRLARHERQVGRLLKTLTRDAPLPPEEWANAETGDEYAELRQTILRDLNRKSRAELRALVRWLVDVLGVTDDFRAELKGIKRRRRKERQLGAKQAAEKRRQKARSLFDFVKAERQLSPEKTDDVLVRRYLREHDQDWSSATDEERERKIASAGRRLRRARKNTGR